MAVFSGNGSAANPSFTFSSDNNTGIFRGGADIISFSTNSTERARFDAAGALELGGTLGGTGNSLVQATGAGYTAGGNITWQAAGSAAALDGWHSRTGFNTPSTTQAGSLLNAFSLLIANNSNAPASAYLFRGYSTEDAAEVCNILADGSAYFGDQVDIGGTEASPNTELRENGDARSLKWGTKTVAGTQAVIIASGEWYSATSNASGDDGVIAFPTQLYLHQAGGDSDVAGVDSTGFYVGGGDPLSTPNITLNTSGFITTETTNGHVNINVTNGALLVSPDGISENATMQIMHDGTVEVGGQINSASPAPNISLDPDGSAYFAGQVDIGGTSASPNAQILEDGNIIAGNDPNNGGANGVRMRPNGFIECTNGNTGNVFQGYNSAVGNTKTSTIHATGFATFGNTDEPITAQQGVRAFMDTASGSNVAGFACENQGTGPTFKGSTGSDAADITFIVSSGGTISAVSTTITALSSERRLKENIVPIDAETAWSTIKEVPYYTYNFISNPEEVCYGPIADEVPEEMRIATERSDEVGTIHTYDNGMLQARLYTALQTALTRIEALEAEVAALKGA